MSTSSLKKALGIAVKRLRALKDQAALDAIYTAHPPCRFWFRSEPKKEKPSGT